jgi:hypothetical protein
MAIECEQHSVHDFDGGENAPPAHHTDLARREREIGGGLNVAVVENLRVYHHSILSPPGGGSC